MSTVTLLFLGLMLYITTTATAAFPGKNGRIAYHLLFSPLASEPSQLTAIEDIEPSGAARSRLRFCYLAQGRPDEGDCALFGGIGGPAYSPDGRHIVFPANYRPQGPGQVGVMNADGSGVRLYRVPPDDVGDPAFSPDGKRVVFTGYTEREEEEQDRDLYILDLRTGRARELLRGGDQATWSSRNRIAFVRRLDLYSVGPDGRRLRRLTRKGGHEPDWSPGGTQIAFRRGSEADGTSIHLLHPATGRVRRLRGTARHAGDPAWSPDGNLIAYEAGQYPTSIHVIRTNGTRNRVVIGGDARSLYLSPQWQALR